MAGWWIERRSLGTRLFVHEGGGLGFRLVTSAVLLVPVEQDEDDEQSDGREHEQSNARDDQPEEEG